MCIFAVVLNIKSSRLTLSKLDGKCGTPEGTRTPNPQNRNLMLYPLSHRRIRFAIIAMFSRFVKGEFVFFENSCFLRQKVL